MAILVADVGGTNSRLGLSKGGQLDWNSIQAFENVAFGSFYDVMRTYLSAQVTTEIQNCIVALAGPISQKSGRLTNLNWEIAVAELKSTARSQQAVLMNDLSALGHSLAHLPENGAPHIHAGKVGEPKSAQRLVIGMGTGFNVSAVTPNTKGRYSYSKAEVGHIQLPPSVLAPFDSDATKHFKIVEEVFSGRGLSNFYAAMTGESEISGAEISRQHAAGTSPKASEALKLYAGALGRLTRELILMYMPVGGVFFAGSVGRGIFEAGMAAQFLEALHADSHFLDNIADVPIHMIKDDAAALIGCAAAGV
tara:strand:- start:14822 stop:15745 length:924 start_codon:yes stop_codon:yes gene_type:complete